MRAILKSNFKTQVKLFYRLFQCMHAFYFVIKSSHSKDLAFFAPEIEHNSLPSHTPTALKLKTYNTNLYLVAKNIY